MKLFQTYQNVLPMYIGYGALEKYGISAPHSVQKYLCRVTSILGYFTLIGGAICSGVSLAFTAETIQEYAQNAPVFATECYDAFIYITLRWRFELCFKLIEMLKITIDERSVNPKKREMYEKCCTFGDKIHHYMYTIFLKLAIPLTTIPTLLASYHLYYSGNLGSDDFYLPIDSWFPFDWRTPLGYFFAYIFEYGILSYLLMVSALEIGFAFTFGWVLFGMTDDIKEDLADLCEYNRTAKKSEAEIYRKICNLVQFHSHIKQAIGITWNIYNILFSVNVVQVLIMVSMSLLVINVELANETPNLVIIAIFTCTLLCTIAPTFGLCFALDEIVSRLNEFDIYQECEWYTFPKNIQRMLPFIVMHYKQSDFFQGCGNVGCNRETCKKITNSSWSFFMTLRTFMK